MSTSDSDLDSLFGDVEDTGESSPFMEASQPVEGSGFPSDSVPTLPTPPAAVASDQAALDGHPLPTLYRGDAPDLGFHVSPLVVGPEEAIAQASSGDNYEDDDLALDLLNALSGIEDENTSDQTTTGCHAPLSMDQFLPDFDMNFIAGGLPTLNTTSTVNAASEAIAPRVDQPLSAAQPLTIPLNGEIPHTTSLTSPLDSLSWLDNLPSLDILSHEKVDLGALSEDAPSQTMVNRRLDLPGHDLTFLVPFLKHAKKRRIDVLVNALRLDIQDRNRFLDSAKKFVLANATKSRKEPEDVFKIKLLTLGLNFLRDYGFGSLFFKANPNGNQAPPFSWPEDSTAILYLFCPLLHRLVANERQRQYAAQSRKAVKKQKPIIPQLAALYGLPSYTLPNTSPPSPALSVAPSTPIPSTSTSTMSRESSCLPPGTASMSVESSVADNPAPPMVEVENNPLASSAMNIDPLPFQSIPRPPTTIETSPPLSSPTPTITTLTSNTPVPSLGEVCHHISPSCQHECGTCAGKPLASILFCMSCICSQLPDSRPMLIPSSKPGQCPGIFLPPSIVSAGSRIVLRDITAGSEQPHSRRSSPERTPSSTPCLDHISVDMQPDPTKGTKRKDRHDDDSPDQISRGPRIPPHAKLKYMVNFMQGNYPSGLPELVFDHVNGGEISTSGFDFIYKMVPVHNEIHKIFILTRHGLQEIRCSDEWDMQVMNVWKDGFMGGVIKVQVKLLGPE